MGLIIRIHFHLHKTTTEYDYLSTYLQREQKGDGSIGIGWKRTIAFPNNVLCAREASLSVQAVDGDGEAGDRVLLLFLRCFSEHPCVLSYAYCLRRRDNPGAKKRRTRVGRGNAAGQGTTAGKGKHGQNSRSGPISLCRAVRAVSVPSLPRSLHRLYWWPDAHLPENSQGRFHKSACSFFPL